MRILHQTLILGTALAAAASCSLIYPLDAEQCKDSMDCPSGSTCNEQNICVLPSAMGGGGTGATGGGTGATGGGGTGGSGGCTKDLQCVAENQGEPYICRDGACINLRNNVETVDGGAEGQCVVVAGAENLSTDQPHFVFGAFSVLPPAAPETSPFTLNYKFAIDEFRIEGGIEINGQRALPVAVVCDANPQHLTVSFDHLVNTVGVSAIITPLAARDLRDQFERIYDNGDGKRVLMISPFESDSSLATLADEGLVWHLLPDSKNMAPPYVPLLERVETYLRGHFWLADDADPIRVALVVAEDNTYLADVGALLATGGELIDETPVSALRFNGMTPTENGSANYRRYTTTYNPDTVNPPDLSDLVAEIKSFAPHVIVSAAGAEFIALLNQLETLWSIVPPQQGGMGQLPPFYVLSPFQRSPALQTALTNNPGIVPLRNRVVGVNPASAEDLTLYNTYYTAFSTGQIGGSCGNACVGTENFYDPVYFLIYAAAASGNQPITGSALAESMQKLMSGTTSFNVGRTDILGVDDYLSGAPVPGSRQFNLQGTLGPPNFHKPSGTRGGYGSVYCVQANLSFAFDVLRYDATTDPPSLYEPSSTPVTIEQCIPEF